MECVTESHFVAVVTREVTLSLPLLTVASCLSYRGYSRVWERERERERETVFSDVCVGAQKTLSRRPSRSRIRWNHVKTTSFLGCDLFWGNKPLLEFLFKCVIGVLYMSCWASLSFVRIKSGSHTLHGDGRVNEFLPVIFNFCTDVWEKKHRILGTVVFIVCGFIEIQFNKSSAF